MKTIYVLASLILLSGIMACIRKPEACLESSASSVKLGQPVTFTDCSKRGESYSMDFGDATPASDNSLTHAYESSGTFTAELTVFSKKEKKSEKATTAISVAAATESEIKGEWDNYKAETYDVFFSTTGTLSYTWDPDMTYDFRTDTVTLDDGFPYDYPWELVSGDELTIQSSFYEIVKLYDDEMILKSSDFFQYNLYYLRK